MDLKHFINIIFLVASAVAYNQTNIDNQQYFDTFFKQDGKNLLLLGENHSSSVASIIYPELIKSFHKKEGLKTLFIEFGPSEAYFYNMYLATGEEKHLAYTIYGGFYSGWKDAWRNIYEYNKTLEEPLEIVGVDFDRTRTFGYSLYNIFKSYKEQSLPVSIDSLMNVIKSQEFFKTYTIGHPTDEGKLFVKNTKSLLQKNQSSLEKIVSKKDMKVISQLISNESTDFGGTREEDIKSNLVNYINSSDNKNFLFLVGRDHAYLKPIYDENPRLAKLLKPEKTFNTLTGVILHENSQQWGVDYKEAITLFEVKDKTPWKDYYDLILDHINSDLTLIELKDELKDLSVYMDYILVAKNHEAIKI